MRWPSRETADSNGGLQNTMHGTGHAPLIVLVDAPAGQRTALEDARQRAGPPLEVEVGVQVQHVLERVVGHAPPGSLPQNTTAKPGEARRTPRTPALLHGYRSPRCQGTTSANYASMSHECQPPVEPRDVPATQA